jgi:hypothetical protein
MGCGLKVYPKEIISEILPILFPEVIAESENTGESYEEYIERMRHLYGVIMNDDELDINFPRP